MNDSAKYHIEISSASIFRLLIILAGVGFLYLIQDVVAIVFFSILLILILQPTVAWMSRYRIPRPAGVLIIYILLLAFFSLAVILLIPPINDQIGQMSVVLGTYWEKLIAYFGVPSIKNDLATFQNTLSSLQEYFGSATQDIFAKLSNVLGTIVTFFIVLVVTFYGLVEESAFVRIVRTTVPMKFQPYLYNISSRIQRKLGLWIRGQIALGFIIFSLTFVGLTLLDVQYALVLALVSGILEFIPYFGPAFSGFTAFLLTVFVNPVKALLVVVLYVVIQQIENHVLVPKIMQKATGLNPVISVIALLTGGKLGGLVGLILAIPVTLVISVFLEDFVDKKSEDQLRLES